MPTDSFRIRSDISLLAVMLVAWLWIYPAGTRAAEKQVVYIVAKSDLPFLKVIGKGVKSVADANGYNYVEMDSAANLQKQLKNAQDAIARNVAGIIISPIDNKSVSEVLALASRAKIPVVIADVGALSGDYLTCVKSDHYRGAYELGLATASAMKEKGWSDSPFAMVTVALTRRNGQDMTNGFRDAMKDSGLTKEVPSHPMQDATPAESQKIVKDMLVATPTLRSVFIESDQAATGALQAIREAKKTGALFVVSFDSTPDVADLLKSESLFAVGLQQPYLIGKKSADALFASFAGTVPARQILVPVLIGTAKNITPLMVTANKTVFGID